jgi:16S rRNA processing protein RimM
MSDVDRVVIADVLRPRGNRGELLVRSQTDVPGRLESLGQVLVRMADGSDRTMTVTEAWPYKEGYVLKLAGVDSISDAEPFAGSELWVEREKRGTLDEGNPFRSDLVGCSVLDAETGIHLGSVAGWQEFGGPLLLEVQAGDRNVLVPFVEAICPVVDLPRKIIKVRLPEGLWEF